MPHRRQRKADEPEHFIPEWAERRGLSQADIVRALAPHGVDKSQVSRWFNGQMPRLSNRKLLASLFALDDARLLLRDPDDDWIARLLKGRTDDERKRARQVLDLMFPDKAA